MSFTEDDTFRVLKRPTFAEMLVKQRQWMSAHLAYTNKEYFEMLEVYGWTYEELRDVAKERFSNADV